jgi:hypothetical protein
MIHFPVPVPFKHSAVGPVMHAGLMSVEQLRCVYGARLSRHAQGNFSVPVMLLDSFLFQTF